jgi:hypothetical protein
MQGPFDRAFQSDRIDDDENQRLMVSIAGFMVFGHTLRLRVSDLEDALVMAFIGSFVRHLSFSSPETVWKRGRIRVSCLNGMAVSRSVVTGSEVCRARPWRDDPPGQQVSACCKSRIDKWLGALYICC